MTQLTQAERDRNTHEYFKAFAVAQQERNAKRHADIVANTPWLQQVRAIQKKLNESEAN